jgi:hypothetical protein
MVISCLGLLSIAQLDADSSQLDIVLRVMLAGFGQAVFQSPNNSALMGAAPKARQGLASGMLATGRVVGQSLSVAVSGALFAGFEGAEAGRALRAGSVPSAQLAELSAVFLRAHRITFECLGVIALLAAATALTRGPRARQAGQAI